MKISPFVTFFTKAKNPRHNPWKIPYDVPTAFPVLDGSPTETAKHWAGEGVQEYRYQNNFRNVRIVDLDHRFQGGRAYKIIIKTNDSLEFVCDLREDTLLDVIKNSMIDHGQLSGEFSWIQNGSQCTLIRIGSDIWNKVQKQDVAKGAKKIPNNSLEFGHLYMTSGGNMAIFISKIYYRNYQLKDDVLMPSNQIESSLLFYSIPNESYIQYINKNILSSLPTYGWKFQNTHSFKIDHGRVLNDSLTLDGVLSYYKNMAKLGLNKLILEIKNRRYSYRTRSMYESDKYSLEGYAQKLSTAISKDNVPNIPIRL